MHRSSGFTLVELLVTIAIFVFMTALILARYNSFNSGTLLNNLAYDTALTIRQAQTYGLSVVSTSATQANFGSAYGVHFDTTSALTQSSFIFYADTGANQHYSSNDTIVNTYNVKQGAHVSKVCGGSSSFNSCDTQLTQLDILFQRPDPSAIIAGNKTSGGGGWKPYKYAEVQLTSGDGTSSHTVKIYQNGQISVQ